MSLQYSYTSNPLMDRTAFRKPQCLYSIAIPLLLLWTVRPVQSISACTRVHFTLPFILTIKPATKVTHLILTDQTALIISGVEITSSVLRSLSTPPPPAVFPITPIMIRSSAQCYSVFRDYSRNSDFYGTPNFINIPMSLTGCAMIVTLPVMTESK